MLRRLLPALLVLLLLLPLLPAAPAAVAPIQRDPHFVAFHSQIPPDARTLMQSLGADVLVEIPKLAQLVVAPRDPAALKTSLASDPRVRYVVPAAGGFELFANVKDTDYFEGRQKYLNYSNFATPWSQDVLGGGVTIAVIDTGVQLNHPDLAPNLWSHPNTGIHGFNLMNPQDPGDLTYLDFDPTDPNAVSHGTMAAGVAMAVDDGLGVVGAAPRAKLMPIRALENEVRLVRAIVLAVENQARVLVFPQGAPPLPGTQPAGQYPALHDAVRYANAHGAVVVGAAGKQMLNTVNRPIAYPAAFPESIAVNAADLVTDDPANLHVKPALDYPFGPTMDLAAPYKVRTACKGANRTCEPAPGSSFAAPQVGGAAALLLSCRPLLEPAQVQRILNGTAINVVTGPNDTGYDQSTGNGVVNMTRAMEWVRPCNMLPWTGPPSTGGSGGGDSGGTTYLTMT